MDDGELLVKIRKLEERLRLMEIERNYFAKELHEQRKETKKMRSWWKHLRKFLRIYREAITFEDGIKTYPTHEELILWYDRLQRLFARNLDKLRW